MGEGWGVEIDLTWAGISDRIEKDFLISETQCGIAAIQEHKKLTHQG